MNYLILVNKKHLLSRDYIPKDLVLYTVYNGPKIDPNYQTLVCQKVLKMFNKINRKAQKHHYTYIIDSAYRSYKYQEKILNEVLKEKGQEAYKTVAIPGSSEHQTGLAIDIALSINGIYTDKFKDDDPEIVFLQSIAYKYGFILRYPKGKENITGFSYEYWHYRYVGKKAAKYIYKNKLTLEEYHEIKGKKYGKRPNGTC